MKPSRRKLVRRSFMAVVTGTSALALQACSSDSGDPTEGNDNNQQTEESSEQSDSDSG